MGAQAGALAQSMRIGANFLYGVSLAHALFESHFGGDWVDPVLYSASAACVVAFTVLALRLTTDG